MENKTLWDDRLHSQPWCEPSTEFGSIGLALKRSTQQLH